MQKTIKVFYKTEGFNLKNIKDEMNLSNHRLVCRLMVENKENDNFFLNEVHRLFNWNVKGIDQDDAFIGFKCPPEVVHTHLSDGDIVAINSKHYIYNNKQWKKVDIETEVETKVEKPQAKRETPVVPIHNSTNNKERNSENGGISEGDTVTIISLTTTKNGKQISILNNRRAKVVGFSTRNPNMVKVILLDKNNQLQKSIVNVDIESLIKEEDVSVV